MAQEKSLPLLDTGNIALLSRALRRYFTKRVPIGEVDDLVQEVLANLHGRQKDTEIENIQGYLFTVAANALARRYRKMPGPPDDPSGEQTRTDPISPERILIGQQRLAAALDVIRGLPPRTQQVFVLHRFEEMTYARIAAQLGISISAVEKHIMLALRALHDNARGNE
jgi:RNA polymerase sigma-70 factor (ECF subfamily)